MSKAVLISIRPEWVEKILAGEKTLEVRKNRPNIETPFKCYIYETQGKSDTPWIDEDGHMIFRGCGKVVADFTCNKVTNLFSNSRFWLNEDDVLQTCLSAAEIRKYADGANGLYGWHISELKIYDAPKELSEFPRPFENCIDKVCDEFGCASCEYGGYIKRPPQSWCYVEELK